MPSASSSMRLAGGARLPRQALMAGSVPVPFKSCGCAHHHYCPPPLHCPCHCPPPHDTDQRAMGKSWPSQKSFHDHEVGNSRGAGYRGERNRWFAGRPPAMALRQPARRLASELTEGAHTTHVTGGATAARRDLSLLVHSPARSTGRPYIRVGLIQLGYLRCLGIQPSPP
jgi:hypothetical protein